MWTRSILRLACPLLASLAASCATPGAALYGTPDAAVRELIASADDPRAADRVLGEGGSAMLQSGDEVADRRDLEFVRELLRQKLAFEPAGDGRTIALLGDGGWELPIPLVRDGDHWRFDSVAGRAEIRNRRVGRNELSTLATLHALVDAQHEYASQGRDGEPPQYAKRLLSTEGRHDGLYWPVGPEEPESPVGPLLADAEDEGYRLGGAEPTPYHGYYYRLLEAQGPSAPGGARSYLDASGRLTGGFGVLAWPARYDDSGVMSFVVDRHGIVFQKKLGPEGPVGVTAFDPDLSWTPTAD